MESRLAYNRLRPAVAAVYVVCLAVMVWISLVPSPPHLPGLFGWDKLQHAGAYGVLTLLGGLAVRYDRRAAWLGSAAVAVAVGGLMEILQGTCTLHRTADWLDLTADAVGALAVVAVALLTVARVRRSAQ